MKTIFAERLKELRQEKSVTSAALANAMSVTVRTVQYWEKGERECSFEMLIHLAEYFDVSVDYLLGKTNY